MACRDVVEVQEEGDEAGGPTARPLHALPLALAFATATAAIAVIAVTAAAIAVTATAAAAIAGVVVDASEAGGERPQLLVQKGGVAVRGRVRV